MVLDLVVEAAEHRGQDPAPADVPGGPHLPLGESEPRVGGDQRHPLVVGGEADPDVQTEDRLLDGEELDGAYRGKRQQQHGDPDGDVQHQQCRLDRPVLVPAPDGEHAGDVEVPPLEQQQREEDHLLVSGDPPEDALLAGCLVIRPRQDAALDIGIAAQLIRMAVVPVVLVDPPPIAEPHAESSDEGADHVVAATDAADLLVTGVMSEERELPEHGPGVRRDRELPQTVAQQEQRCTTRGQSAARQTARGR
jgi:hypothetical protein